MKRQVETSQYIQIYEQIREDIIQGIYAYGSKLPSKRLIAEERGVSVITAEHAYALLVEEGDIEARRAGNTQEEKSDDCRKECAAADGISVSVFCAFKNHAQGIK